MATTDVVTTASQNIETMNNIFQIVVNILGIGGFVLGAINGIFLFIKNKSNLKLYILNGFWVNDINFKLQGEEHFYFDLMFFNDSERNIALLRMQYNDKLNGNVLRFSESCDFCLKDNLTGQDCYTSSFPVNISGKEAKRVMFHIESKKYIEINKNSYLYIQTNKGTRKFNCKNIVFKELNPHTKAGHDNIHEHINALRTINL